MKWRINHLKLTHYYAFLAFLLIHRMVIATPFEGFWSNRPAYTILFPHQTVSSTLTTDDLDGVFEDCPAPERLPPSSQIPPYRAMGEGIDFLDTHTYTVTEGRYTNPARLWEGEPYPIGNGFTGVSVFHGSGRDRYTLSAGAFWSGGKNLTIDANGDKPYNGTHGPENVDGFGGNQPVTDLIIDFNRPVKAKGFRRELDFDAAEARVIAQRGNATLRATAFASYPDRMIVIHYTASSPLDEVAITFTRNRSNDCLSFKPSTLTFDAALANGIKCHVQSELTECDAREIDVDVEGIRLRGVTQWTLLTTINTNYTEFAPTAPSETNNAEQRSYDTSEKIAPIEFPSSKTSTRADLLLNSGQPPSQHLTTTYSFKELQERHHADVRALYRRLKFSLTVPQNDLPTPERLAAYRKNPEGDRALEALFVAFGRYLLIATSRPGALPAGLQGIWNPYPEAPWGNDYHSNINAQMVYWLAERGALPECHRALLDYLLTMRPMFREKTAAYLRARGERIPEGTGWLVYTSHNPFGAGGWRMNLPASAWYALHFRDHAAYKSPTPHRWAEALPILTELSHFWIQRLKALGPNGAGFTSNGHPVDPSRYPELMALPAGTLVIPNGWSPEHGPHHEDGVTHDQELISELFQATQLAAEESNASLEITPALTNALQYLAPPQIGRKGNLMEWLIDRDPETDHRHTSHLFALYPGTTISPASTPRLAIAAERALRFRKTTGDSRRSWAWAWRAALWARLHRGDEMRAMLQGLLCHNVLDNGLATHHIPLQIDGNYGIAAAVLEGLVSSRPGEIHLLPALPSVWPKGELIGVRAHDGITVDLHWHNGHVTQWRLHAPRPTPVKLSFNGKHYPLTAPCEECGE
jgi:alpha-L-fucosidase 2